MKNYCELCEAAAVTSINQREDGSWHDTGTAGADLGAISVCPICAGQMGEASDE